MPAIWIKHSLVIFLFTLLLGAIFYTTSFDLVRIYTVSPTFNHGFLIIPISLYLVYLNRKPLLQMTPKLFAPALIPFLLGLVIWAVGHIKDIQFFTHIGFVGMLISGYIGLLGYAVSKLLWFPLWFLGFLIPFGEEIVPMLQDLTAWFIVTVLNIIGIPVLQNGVFLDTPSGKFEVAEACAGLRFLVANVVVATLFSFLSFNGMKKKVIFIFLGIITPIIANWIRATAIVMIATYTNNEYAVGFDHLVYGWGFFVVIMGLLLWLGIKMADDNAYPKHYTVRLIDKGDYPLSKIIVFMGALLLITLSVAWMGWSPLEAIAPEAPASDMPEL